MNSQKRIIDASRSYPSQRTVPQQQLRIGNNRTVPIQPLRTGNTYSQRPTMNRQGPQFAPNATVTVKPHANIIYQPEPQVVKAEPTTTSKPEPEKEKTGLALDPEMMNFDIRGTNINEVYNNNSTRIKIIPE